MMKRRVVLAVGLLINCLSLSSIAAVLNVPSEYATIQAAIDAAGGGDKIIVHPGKYAGFFLDRGALQIQIQSTEPEDPAIVAATIIESGIVAGGNFTFNGLSFIRDPNVPSIVNGINHGITLYGVEAGVIKNCQVKNFGGSGISSLYLYGNGNITIENCVISNNGYFGTPGFGPAGISISESAGSIQNCLITGNSGGGIRIGITCESFVIKNSTIADNVLNMDGYIEDMTGVGIIWFQEVLNSKLSVQNSILSNPAPSEYSKEISGYSWSGGPVPSNVSMEILNSHVDGGLAAVRAPGVEITWGEENTSGDPCFVSRGHWDMNSTPQNYWTEGDYHLLRSSLCINAGDPNYAAEPNETDLDGNPRVLYNRVDMGAYEFVDGLPVADAGSDQTVFAWIDGKAEVTLDGSGSSDADGDTLTYKWTWTIDANTYEANGVSPAIELPVGVHMISLVVNDGMVDSAADDVNVTVVAAVKGNLCVMPSTINRRSHEKYILAAIRLPEGIGRGDIDGNEPLTLYPGGITAKGRRLLPCNERGHRFVSIFVFFDKDDVMAAVPRNGITPIRVAGKLKSGQNFYGCDTVRIIDLKLKWPWYQW